MERLEFFQEILEQGLFQSVDEQLLLSHQEYEFLQFLKCHTFLYYLSYFYVRFFKYFILFVCSLRLYYLRFFCYALSRLVDINMSSSSLSYIIVLLFIGIYYFSYYFLYRLLFLYDVNTFF